MQARNKIGLGVDNVYEAGEIADIPRLLLKGPGTACNPRIRTVQFNLIPIGLPIEKHKIDTLTMNLLELSRRGSSRSVLAYAAAVRCSETARMCKASAAGVACAPPPTTRKAAAASGLAFANRL